MTQDNGSPSREALMHDMAQVYADATGYSENYVQFHRGLSSPSADKIRTGIAAVLAALERPITAGVEVPYDAAATDAVQRLLERGKATVDADGYLRLVPAPTASTSDEAPEGAMTDRELADFWKMKFEERVQAVDGEQARADDLAAKVGELEQWRKMAHHFLGQWEAAETKLAGVVGALEEANAIAAVSYGYAEASSLNSALAKITDLTNTALKLAQPGGVGK